MIRALSYFQMFGRSWIREMRPFPMAPTLMRLLGAVCPNTEDGTMAGKPATKELEATAPATAVLMSSRRGRWLLNLFVMPQSLACRFGRPHCKSFVRDVLFFGDSWRTA